MTQDKDTELIEAISTLYRPRMSFQELARHVDIPESELTLRILGQKRFNRDLLSSIHKIFCQQPNVRSTAYLTCHDVSLDYYELREAIIEAAKKVTKAAAKSDQESDRTDALDIAQVTPAIGKHSMSGMAGFCLLKIPGRVPGNCLDGSSCPKRFNCHFVNS